jgi:hypothetical protein
MESPEPGTREEAGSGQPEEAVSRAEVAEVAELVGIRVSDLVLETRAAMSIQAAREILKVHKRCGVAKVFVDEATAVITGATRWPNKETT